MRRHHVAAVGVPVRLLERRGVAQIDIARGEIVSEREAREPEPDPEDEDEGSGDGDGDGDRRDMIGACQGSAPSRSSRPSGPIARDS